MHQRPTNLNKLPAVSRVSHDFPEQCLTATRLTLERMLSGRKSIGPPYLERTKLGTREERDSRRRRMPNAEGFLCAGEDERVWAEQGC